jgi:hypothetical protein
MNVLVGVIIFCFFLPHSTCKAETASLYAISNTSLHTDSLKKQDPQAAPDHGLVEISYGFMDVKFYNGPVPELGIERPSRAKTGLSVALISTAEAAVPPDAVMVKEFERICNAVSDAGRLDDLKPVLLDKDFAFLKSRVKAGVSQYVVLAILQGMRPQVIRIVDPLIEEGRAEFVVLGNSTWGPMWGQIHMVKVEGAWKIEEESWHAGKYSEQRDGLVATVFKSISDVDQYIHPDPAGPAPKMSSGNVVWKRPLTHTRVNDHRRKQAFMFVFPLNQDKAGSGRSAALRDDTRTRIHGLRSIKLSPEQESNVNRYLADLFVEKEEERYTPGEWNIVVPNKSPHEVTVSWLWSF